MRVLFVCRGNTCRSPMMKFAFDKYLADMGITDIETDSAGLSDRINPLSEHAAQALDMRRIPHTAHISKPLDERLLDRADAVICAQSGQAAAIKDKYGEAAKIVCMRDICGSDIEDPYGKGCDEYVRTLEVIESAAPSVYEYLRKYAF